MDEFIGKFLGPDKITGIVEEEVEINGPDKPTSTYIRVELERIVDKKPTSVSSIWHPGLFKECVTDEQTDPSDLQDSRVVVIRNVILYSMLEYAITIGEVDYINQRVLTSIQHTASRANDKLWGNAANERNLIDLDRVLNNG